MSRDVMASALLDASATVLYVVGVASFLTYAPQFFGTNSRGILAPVVILLLFIISAAVTGSLVLGKPILWYLAGRRREAIVLFIATLASLVFFAFFALLLILFFV